jgi:hypothetical protein
MMADRYRLGVQKFGRHVAITAFKQQRAECQPLTGRP